MLKSVLIPPPHDQDFSGAILHPTLYLWDSWCCQSGKGVDLYCLALARTREDGSKIHPSERNHYPFHIRHFHSVDGGDHWKDQGCFQVPGQAEDKHDARNIWSGSVLEIAGKGKLYAYTALQQGDDDHPFIQSLAAGFSPEGRAPISGKVLLCPLRDREKIQKAGYYLAEENNIGSKDGEEGGPILAWRDPYLFEDSDGKLMMAWAAKISPGQCAMGLASLSLDGSLSCSVDTLFPPVLMPNDKEFRQLEVPKIYFDPLEEHYILIISTTTRASETQGASEVHMHHHLYTSKSLVDSWQPGGTETSQIGAVDTLFGMSALQADYLKKEIYCMAPYTELAGEKLQLSFPPKFNIDLTQLNKVAQVKANRTY